RAGAAGPAATDRTAALSGPLGRAAIPPDRPGQPPGGRRTGEALGDGATRSQRHRRAASTRTATAPSPPGAQAPGTGSLPAGRPENPGTVAAGPLDATATEGLPTLPHRQGSRPPLRSRCSAGPHCLERG